MEEGEAAHHNALVCKMHDMDAAIEQRSQHTWNPETVPGRQGWVVQSVVAYCVAVGPCTAAALALAVAFRAGVRARVPCCFD